MLFLLLLLIYISVKDYRTHTISNSSILVLAVVLYLFGAGEVRYFWACAFAVISVFVAQALSIGGGDIKLVTVLAAFAHPDITLTLYLWESCICAIILVFAHRISSRNWSGNIALAPAICAPFLITLL